MGYEHEEEVQYTVRPHAHDVILEDIVVMNSQATWNAIEKYWSSGEYWLDATWEVKDGS